MNKVAIYKEAIYKLAEEKKEKKISLGKGALVGAGIGALPTTAIGAGLGAAGKGGALGAGVGAGLGLPFAIPGALAGASVGTLVQFLRQRHKTNQLQEEALRRQLANK